MIYFAMTPTGSIKIGCTEQLDVRLGQLAVRYGSKLSLLATMPGGREDEREIHERFAHLRFGRTEQFRPGPDLMKFIGKPLLVTANPESIEVAEVKSKFITMTFSFSEATVEKIRVLAERRAERLAALGVYVNPAQQRSAAVEDAIEAAYQAIRDTP